MALFILCVSHSYAQVTIGKLTPPDPSAALQVIAPDFDKGVLVPSLTEAQRDAITDPADGLLIYNIDENCFNYWNLSDSVWQSLCGKEGKAQFDVSCSSVQVNGIYGDGVALNSSNFLRITVTVTKLGTYNFSAVATPDNGYFFETSGTFYSLGTFTLTIPGTGQPVNHTQGADLVDPSDDTPDQFTLSSAGGGADCNFEVNVRSTSARPEYRIDCSTIEAQGDYFEDVPLSNALGAASGLPNRIKVTLTNIPSSAYGSVAILTTNTVDGFSFQGEAVLMSSTQEVFLAGTGIPRGLNDKTFTITTNSVLSTASCQVTVSMLIPRKRLMSLGNDSEFGYNAGTVSGLNPPHNFNALLTDKNNFGYNQWSILKFAGFNNVAGAGTSRNFVTTINTWNDDDRDIVAMTLATWQAMSATTLHDYLTGSNGHRKIDIFLIGYTGGADWFRNSNAGDADKCRELANFVKEGGILMICSEELNSNANFLNMMFDNPVPAISSGSGHGPGTNYTLGFNSSNTPAGMRPYYCKDDDPILAGPFNNILGRNWGEDASTTRYITNLPLDSVIIYSGARGIGSTTYPETGVTIFRHVSYPFIFIGDGGFNSARVRTSQSVTDNICPLTLTSITRNGRTYPSFPNFRMNFGGSGNRVDNTSFTANAFAWCILQAEEYRRLHK
jgi:hypothetical protein